MRKTEKVKFHTTPTTALTDTLIDIARSQVAVNLDNEPGPSTWDEITSFDFGPEHDFEIEDFGSIVIITQVSEAAKQWLYAHLPADCPRWGLGFAVERNYIDEVLAGMDRDGLMSELEYAQAMNEMQQQMNQGE